MKSRCFCSGGIGQSCQHSVTAYVGMTDDSAGGSDSGEENDQEGDKHKRTHTHSCHPPQRHLPIYLTQ